ncbi:MAG: hypothetical protein K2O57_08900, partial [Acetatifactor sp.]|nr:hypothetical protein [Acetatifactor sp.]
SYRASRATYRRFSLTDYRGGSLTYNGNSLNATVTDGQNGNGQTVAGGNQNGQETEGTGKKLYTLEDWQNSLSISTGRVNIRTAGSTLADFRQATVRYIFDLLFANRRGRMNQWMEEQSQSYSSSNSISLSTSQTTLQQSFVAIQTNVPQTNAKVLSYTEGTLWSEQEATSFSTVGTVRTADGREINFNVDIGMSREFQQAFQSELQLPSVSMCDPLVINLDTDVAEFSDQKFFFDLDADGELDEISQMDAKSGYLALDKNGDGVINDGSELFGTKSGDGFADLAKYDEDGNGWIDENDPIWSKLKIWCKDENGNDVLYRLADKGVGAICLQKAATDFTLKGATGQTSGAIRSTGVFLYENGNVGTIQHVDVAKYEQGA